MLPWASQSELIHASQKDQSSVAALQNECKDIAIHLLGQRAGWFDEIDLACNLVYYGLPRLSGLGTLGEGHSEIIPVAPSRSRHRARILANARESLQNPTSSSVGVASTTAPVSAGIRATHTDSVSTVASAASPPTYSDTQAPRSVTNTLPSHTPVRILSTPPYASSSATGSSPPLSAPSPSSSSTPSPPAAVPTHPLADPYMRVSSATPYTTPLTPAPQPHAFPSSSSSSSLPPQPHAFPSSSSSSSLPPHLYLPVLAYLPISPRRALALVLLQALLPYLHTKLLAGAGAPPSAPPAPTLSLPARLLYHVRDSRVYRLLYSFCRRALAWVHEYGGLLQRLQLTAFYLTGAYHSLPHRLAGVRYKATTASQPLYLGLLGALMAAQLLGELAERALAWRRERARVLREREENRQRDAESEERRQRRLLAKQRARFELEVNVAKMQRKAEEQRRAVEARREGVSPQPLEPVVEVAGVQYGHIRLEDVVVSEGEESDYDSDDGDSDVDAVEVGRGEALGGRAAAGLSAMCNVCLSHCTHTTATICGHLFCWRCASKAVIKERKCPVCRAPCLPSQLLRLFQFQ